MGSKPPLRSAPTRESAQDKLSTELGVPSTTKLSELSSTTDSDSSLTSDITSKMLSLRTPLRMELVHSLKSSPEIMTLSTPSVASPWLDLFKRSVDKEI